MRAPKRPIRGKASGKKITQRLKKGPQEKTGRYQFDEVKSVRGKRKAHEKKTVVGSSTKGLSRQK